MLFVRASVRIIFSKSLTFSESLAFSETLAQGIQEFIKVTEPDIWAKLHFCPFWSKTVQKLPKVSPLETDHEILTTFGCNLCQNLLYVITKSDCMIRFPGKLNFQPFLGKNALSQSHRSILKSRYLVTPGLICVIFQRVRVQGVKKLGLQKKLFASKLPFLTFWAKKRLFRPYFSIYLFFFANFCGTIFLKILEN